MRPGSIVWFERLNILGLVLAVSADIVLWDQTRALAAEDGSPIAMVLAILAAAYGLWLLVTLAISRWRSRVFRSIYAAISVLSLLGVALMFMVGHLENGLVDTVILLTQCGLNVVALVFLYWADSTSWLTGGDPPHPEILP